MDAKDITVGKYYYNRYGEVILMCKTNLCHILYHSTEGNYHPIPLTEEWHNKFGSYKNGFISFEYKLTERKKILFSGDYIYLRDIQDMNNIESIGDDICVLWNNDERRRGIYVHEYQNLYYALTGEELTITQ